MANKAVGGKEAFEPQAPQENKRPVKVGKITLEKGRQWIFDLPRNEKLSFVKCPAGSYTMGYKKEEIKFSGADANVPHKVTISRPFWLSQYKLTAGQWAAIENDNSSSDDGDAAEWKNYVKFSVDVPSLLKKLNDNFGKWLPDGYVFRLPTEAEWEYALKANSKSKKNPYLKFRCTGEDIMRISVQKDIHDAARAPVGTKEPNPWGLYDMIGLGVETMLDTVPSKDMNVIVTGDYGWIIKLNYPKDTIDPVFCYEGVGMGRITRAWAPAGEGNKMCMKNYNAIRLCIGPDLIAERKGKKSQWPLE